MMISRFEDERPKWLIQFQMLARSIEEDINQLPLPAQEKLRSFFKHQRDVVIYGAPRELIDPKKRALIDRLLGGVSPEEN